MEMEPPVNRRPFPLRSVLIALPVIVLLLLVACTPSHPQSTFDTAGPVAEKQRTLFLFIFWMAVAVFVVVEAVLVYTIIHYRRRPGEGMPKQTHGNLKLEIAWTIVPAIVLVVIAVPTIDLILETGGTPSECKGEPAVEECLLVNVTGHQWWWEFDYPQLGLVTANELHVSAGTTVFLSLDSADVLHSFWVPKLAGKTDMVPMSVNTMWLRASEAGTFEGQCAELCGFSHAKMRLRIIAHPSEGILCEGGQYEPCPGDEFGDWVAGQLPDAEQPTLGTPQKKGEELFTAKQCFICHTIRGNPLALGTIGPDLTHFASRDTLAAGVLENDPEGEGLREWLRDPDAVKPANIMWRDAAVYDGDQPDLFLTRADIEELVAYLVSLK